MSTQDPTTVAADPGFDDDDDDFDEALAPDADEAAEEQPEPQSRLTPDEPS